MSRLLEFPSIACLSKRVLANPDQPAGGKKLALDVSSGSCVPDFSTNPSSDVRSVNKFGLITRSSGTESSDEDGWTEKGYVGARKCRTNEDNNFGDVSDADASNGGTIDPELQSRRCLCGKRTGTSIVCPDCWNVSTTDFFRE